MVGNVWEWTRSLWGRNSGRPEFKYPYDAGDGREDLEAACDAPRLLRGGSFSDTLFDARCACRLWFLPGSFFNFFGFRVVLLQPVPEVGSGKGEVYE
jgi:formylglycine-generating enzyme required for sulfatase activity